MKPVFGKGTKSIIDPMAVQEYIDEIFKRYRSGVTAEHLYRGCLKDLIIGSVPNIVIWDGPEKLACGIPEWIIGKGNILAGYLKTDKIGQPLVKRVNDKELGLNKRSLTNLILTNFLQFNLFREGELISSASIAEIKNGKIVPRYGDQPSMKAIINEFCRYKRPSIDSLLNLALVIADNAQLLACMIEDAIKEDHRKITEKDKEKSKQPLEDQLLEIHHVIKGETPVKDLANIYAQTISFGMFAARLYGGPSMKEFSRHNAVEFIPSSLPFLERLFRYLASPVLDNRIVWILNEFADVFRATDIVGLLDDFKNHSNLHDPIKQFYETFLDEYDPQLPGSDSEFSRSGPMLRFIEKAVHDCISSYDVREQ